MMGLISKKATTASNARKFNDIHHALIAEEGRAYWTNILVNYSINDIFDEPSVVRLWCTEIDANPPATSHTDVGANSGYSTIEKAAKNFGRRQVRSHQCR